MSAGGESGFSTRNATRQPGELGARRRDRLIPALAPVGRGRGRRGRGRERRRRGGRGARGGWGRSRGKTPLPPEALPLYPLLHSSSSSKSCREPQPKQAAASGSARRPRRRLTREEKKHVTEPPRSAARPAAAAAAAGRLPPGLSTFPARPPPRPPSPPRPCRRGARARPRHRAPGSAPTRPAAWAQSRPLRAPPGAPRPAGIPAAGAGRGVFGCLPESTRGVWENAGGRAGRRRSEGGGRREALRLLGSAWGGPGRRRDSSWAGSYLTGKSSPSGESVSSQGFFSSL